VPPDPVDLRAIWQPAFGKRYHLQSVDYQRGERGHSVNLFAPFTEGVLRPSMRGDAEAIHIAAFAVSARLPALSRPSGTVPHHAFDNVEPALLA